VSIVLLGINHRSAPIEVRERLAIPESRLLEATRSLARFPGIEEGVILSTCNRVEVLARQGNGSLDLRAFLRQYFQVDLAPFEPYLYELREEEAMRHLFRVAASLDSMVVGEPQILGQVKDACALARAAGALHSELDALLSRAFAVARRVRSETAVGASSVSVASVAVELAKKIRPGQSVFLVGAGKMTELAARHLVAQGAGAIFVANRTHARAQELALKFAGTAIPFDQLYQTADRADIVITSTGAPHAVFRREHGEQFLHRRKNRPMFFIDIAVPRDVAPEMQELDGIFVYDIDDLQGVVASHAATRSQEARRAEAIIEAELARFLARRQSLDVVPTIVGLQERLEGVRKAELERHRARFGALSPEQEAALEAMTRGLVNKVLHTPISTLKSAAQQQQRDPEEGRRLVELIRRLFNLDDRDKDEGA
jgi:glutamyl-tRNA reductase